MNYFNLELAQIAVYGLKPNLLCWQLPEKHFDNYTFIYVGKNNQTFFNLYMGLKSDNWFLYDIDTAGLQKTATFDVKWMQKRFFLIEKCRQANSIGIVVGTVASNEVLPIVSHIQALAKKHNIRSYLISVGKINPAKLANFPEIDIFVCLTCPENTVYLSKDFYKPLVTVYEVEVAFNPIWQTMLPDTYSVDIKQFINEGKYARDVTGELSVQTSESVNTAVDDESEKVYTLDIKSSNLVAEQSTVNGRFSRNWNGLELKIGTDAPAELQEGRRGLAIKYDEVTN